MKINSLKFNNSTIHKMYHGNELVNKIGDAFTYMEASGDTPTPPAPVPYSGQYLTIESTSNNNTIYWRSSYTNAFKTISASTDNGNTWTAYTSSSGQTGTTIATLNSGDTIIFKGENAQYFSQGIFKPTSSFIVYGNIMSLVYGDNFSGQTVLSSGGTFSQLFLGCTGLTSAENLILPATTLASYCYQNMFNGCSSLTTAPALPATTLVEGCYYNMFYGCTSLGDIICLATDISASNCTDDWVNGVASVGGYLYVPSGNPANWPCGFNGVPSDWTIEDANGDTYECTGGGEPSTDVPLYNGFAVKVNGEWYENMRYGISSIDDIERYLHTMGSGDMGIDPSDVEELAIGMMVMNINLDGENWYNCTGLTLAQSVNYTDDIHNFPAMQWVNVKANDLNYMGLSGLFSDMNCCPIYVPGNYFEDYEMNWENETTEDCEGTVADRLVAWTDWFDPNS